MPRKSKNVDELHDLRQENANLRKRVARLRRQLAQFDVPDEEVSPAAPEPPTTTKGGPACEKCGGTELRPFKTPNSIVNVCMSCKHRQRSVV